MNLRLSDFFDRMYGTVVRGRWRYKYLSIFNSYFFYYCAWRNGFRGITKGRIISSKLRIMMWPKRGLKLLTNYSTSRKDIIKISFLVSSSVLFGGIDIYMV